MKSTLETNLEFKFDLFKDYRIHTRKQLNSSNFLIIDDSKLVELIYKNKLPFVDGYFIISNEEDCIIRQGVPQIKNTNLFSLAVFYRCNRSDCTISEDDKIGTYSYDLIMYYKGYSLEHQNPEKPNGKLEGNDYWHEDTQFLNNTFIYSYDWQLIEYEEEKGIFGKTYSKVSGKSNTYYGGDYRSWHVFTDDGHVRAFPDNNWRIKDENGNNFIVLLYFESFPNYYQYERYTRKEISFLDVLANVFALASTVLNLMGLSYGFLYSQNYNNYKIIEYILTKK